MRRRLLMMLLTIVLALTMQDLTFCQTPTPTVAPMSQPSPTQLSARSLPEVVLGNLGAILAGVAGVIAAIVAYLKSIRAVKNDFICFLGERASIELIKNQGHFWDTNETRPFETALIEQIVKYKTALDLIQKHGSFVTSEQLNKLQIDLDRCGDMLRKLEGDLIILSGDVSTIKDPKAKEEQARMVIEILRKGFSK